MSTTTTTTTTTTMTTTMTTTTTTTTTMTTMRKDKNIPVWNKYSQFCSSIKRRRKPCRPPFSMGQLRPSSKQSFIVRISGCPNFTKNENANDLMDHRRRMVLEYWKISVATKMTIESTVCSVVKGLAQFQCWTWEPLPPLRDVAPVIYQIIVKPIMLLSYLTIIDGLTTTISVMSDTLWKTPLGFSCLEYLISVEHPFVRANNLPEVARGYQNFAVVKLQRGVEEDG
ncbi:hypothetical protein HZH68_003133 [Vespula germanica]|uniref:Uncharacterized protein n=1 Tax=Vespula germanica TaxID=30212 RepID=A0A834U2M0_VESGE|nr:hypothetical protein HZH68_003133 [Vespula germanica]